MAIDMEVASSGGSGDLSIDALSALSDAAAAAIPALQSQSQSHHQAAPTDTSALQQKDQLGMAEQAVNADMQVEHEQATGASTRNDIPHTQASSPKSAASSTPSMLARPAGLAGTPAAAAGHAPVATDLTGFSHRPSTGSTQQEHASTSINSPPASHPGASYAENSNPADAASAAAAALAKANNGSSASVLSTGSSSKGRSHSPDSSVKGNLKRPFSRVDVLLEAAASPHAPSPTKQSKTKKSPKPSSISSESTSNNNNNNAAMTSSSFDMTPAANGTSTAVPAQPLPRKSAYQGPKISMACYSCRSSKTRCSGTQPCNRCGLKRMECSYPLRDGRTANRASQSANTLPSLSSPSRNRTSPTQSANGYEPGPMQRFNQAFALSSTSSNSRHSNNSPGATYTTPSVFQHQPPPSRSHATHSHDVPASSRHSFPHPQHASQRTSPNAGETDVQGHKRPSTGGSTTSRTHMSLPLNGNTSQSPSISPEEAPPRLSTSYPHFYPSHPHDTMNSGRPATAGASQSKFSKSLNVKEENDGGHSSSRDRSHSFPRPVPSYLKDYVLPLPSLRNTPLASPVMQPHDRIGQIEEGDAHHHEPEQFREGTSKMKETNALQLKEHRRPMNAHPESSAFSEAEPSYKNGSNDNNSKTSALSSIQGLPYPSSSAYLPFSLQQHRFSPHFSNSISPHHVRGEDAYYAHAAVKLEAELSPKIDELSSSAAATPFEQDTSRTEEDTYNSEVDRSRTSPPSTASTGLTSLQSSIYGGGSKPDTPTNNAGLVNNVVGPAYLHSNNLLPPIMGNRALPDTLLPWRALLLQAGIPDLETLKSEIPFEAVKRYVDCLAESWPDVLPTFTKRFQLRYAIEDALTRACRDMPSKIPVY